LAVALLERFAPNDALLGDVTEEFSRGRSRLWLWRQVTVAIAIRVGQVMCSQRTFRLVRATFAVVALVVSAIGLRAETRDHFTIVGRDETSISGREVIRAIDDLPPRSSTGGWHTHFGEMIGFVVEGSVVVEHEGKAPVTAKVGDSFLIPSGKPHRLTNPFGRRARMFVTFIAEKGQALSRGAPCAEMKRRLEIAAGSPAELDRLKHYCASVTGQKARAVTRKIECATATIRLRTSRIAAIASSGPAGLGAGVACDTRPTVVSGARHTNFMTPSSLLSARFYRGSQAVQSTGVLRRPFKIGNCTILRR
jgi:mannose-6-phosphate isomerase-like protein (cupin superfamily)